MGDLWLELTRRRDNHKNVAEDEGVREKKRRGRRRNKSPIR